MTRIERAVPPATVPAAAETTSGMSGRAGVSRPRAAVSSAASAFGAAAPAAADGLDAGG